MTFHDEAQKAISQGQSWAKVRESTADLQKALRDMKFELPGDGEEKVTKKVCCAFSRNSFGVANLFDSTRIFCIR
jgi:vacuolar-type H+-ATPase catalytic subunit A/Vma1